MCVCVAVGDDGENPGSQHHEADQPHKPGQGLSECSETAAAATTATLSETKGKKQEYGNKRKWSACLQQYIPE